MDRFLGTRGAGSKGFLGLEGVERSARQWLHARQRRQAAVLAQGGVGHGGIGRFQRTSLKLGAK